MIGALGGNCAFGASVRRVAAVSMGLDSLGGGGGATDLILGLSGTDSVDLASVRGLVGTVAGLTIGDIGREIPAEADRGADGFATGRGTVLTPFDDGNLGRSRSPRKGSLLDVLFA